MKFTELNIDNFAESIVVLDVDGTLVFDGDLALSTDTILKIKELSNISKVYLFSNGDVSRTKKISNDCGVYFLESEYKKPSAKVAESLIINDEKLFVIGDKFITDGLFASNIGASFVHVDRIMSGQENFFNKIIYILDSIFGFFIKPFLPFLHYINLLRPSQWIKNILVFSPIFFAGAFYNLQALQFSSVAFVTFCVASSAMYILNDIFDRENDKLHPVKRFRPIASGAVVLREATIMFSLLLLFLIILVSSVPVMWPAVFFYILLNTSYSLFLKNIPILDIISVAFSYVLRVFLGGEASQIYVSPWIIVCVFFGALFLVTGKRLAEFNRKSKRKVLHFYSEKKLKFLLIISAIATLLSYGFYTIFGSHIPNMVYSTFFVAVALLKVSGVVFLSKKGVEYPETLIFKDRVVLMTVGAWVFYVFALLYLNL